MSLLIRLAAADDRARLQSIRAAAFAPVFASFRSLLGDDVYDLAQRASDDRQGATLDSLLAGAGGWTTWVAELDGAVVGFVTTHHDDDTGVGEIGLNAVDPVHAGRGVGLALYRHALDGMRAAGLKVATVSTGGDASHAAARRAYEKAGFDRVVPSVWLCQRL